MLKHTFTKMSGCVVALPYIYIYKYSIQEILFLVLLLKVRKREKKVAILSPCFILCTLFVKTCNETQALRKNN
jgi:hypothetical protein